MTNVLKIPTPTAPDESQLLADILEEFAEPEPTLHATRDHRRERYAKMTSTMKTKRARAAIHLVP